MSLQPLHWLPPPGSFLAIPACLLMAGKSGPAESGLGPGKEKWSGRHIMWENPKRRGSVVLPRTEPVGCPSCSLQCPSLRTVPAPVQSK